MFSGGNANQERQKRKLFDRTASQWALWWEQHWAEHVQDVTYSHVNLLVARIDDHAVTGLQPGKHFKTGPGSSGYVVQSVFDPAANVVFHDLDTGRNAGLPQKWRNTKRIEPQLDEIVAWAAGEGFDIMETEYVSPRDRQRSFAIRPIGLRAWELGKECWKMSSTDVTLESLQAEELPLLTCCCTSTAGADRLTRRRRRLSFTSRARKLPGFYSSAFQSKTRMSKSES